ncbi:5,10-methylene tetrahydromethanopterin reductase [Bordetella genomosp. 10]|uniref:5,10-methylene tetrahydromethanopterin reductase n=1 Tax=Bordetella genomosp. 10 TaxID=1416804 RepID=A0A261SCW9_9BORD|nr:LLM class flavin-dependent oxidoreductase [Bordetella genomosp. 10]OZI34650.1 5,10-methylene tetrahydromethanopterin reductase [Bordetella genomosp. 10]
MSRQIRINAFALAAPSHLSPGLWRHPRDRSSEYNTLRYWTDLASIAERGKFDGIFLADGISLYDVYKGSSEPAVRLGVQFPRLDPILLVSAMAHVTQHLGFGITSSVTYEPPYLFARRMNTLDHITQGRVGWNIVTSFGNSGTKALKGEDAKPHGDRYALADDYLDLVYKYWEGSWEDAAAVRDRATGVFADPGLIHEVSHHSANFKSEGIFIAEPSPQRTPLLYQAGASTRGREFAARHAECVFVSGPTKKVVGDLVADVRRRAADNGRDPREILFFASIKIIPGKTESEAVAKYEDYRQYASVEGAAALYSRWSGIDLAQYDLDEPLRHEESNHMQSAVESYTTADPGRTWTVRDILEAIALGNRGSTLLVGSPSEVADGLQSWVDETDVDGFNLGYVLAHESFADFAELVVPELQRRGVYKKAYRAGTLREKLFGRSPRLGDSHPAHKHRRPGNAA